MVAPSSSSTNNDRPAPTTGQTSSSAPAPSAPRTINAGDIALKRSEVAGAHRRLYHI